MTRPRSRRGPTSSRTSSRIASRISLGAATLLVISSLGVVASPATAEPDTIAPGPTPPDVRTLGDPVAGPRDVDVRGTAAPTAVQRQAVEAMGDVTARWGSLG